MIMPYNIVKAVIFSIKSKEELPDVKSPMYLHDLK